MSLAIWCRTHLVPYRALVEYGTEWLVHLHTTVTHHVISMYSTVYPRKEQESFVMHPADILSCLVILEE